MSAAAAGPDLTNAIAIMVVAFITAVVGPGVLLLLSRAIKKPAEPPAAPDRAPLEGEAIALILRMETRVQLAENSRERADQRFRRWREYATRLSMHVTRLGETPEAPPEEDD